MTDKLYYTLFKTDWGWVGLLYSQIGLLSVTFPQKTQEQAFGLLGERARRSILESEHFPDIVRRLQEYFSGAIVEFPDKLDYRYATKFQAQVWEATRLIPYGETGSYGWVAKKIGKPRAARAVGKALNQNPFSIVVPCHRVISSTGRIGGFSSGVNTKLRLLVLEENAHQ